MNIPFERLEQLAGGVAAYPYRQQPYYIVAPAWDEASLEARVLHGLCSVLNQIGCEAWLDAPTISGALWTPPLSPTLQRAHCLADKRPIVVWPECLPGNPLRLGLSVCLALSQARSASNDPDDPEGPMLVYKHHPALPMPGPCLSLPCVDTQLYAPPAAAATGSQPQRNLVLVYCSRYSGPLRDHAQDGCERVELSPRQRRTQSETAALYQRARVMYAYDADLAAVEARLCGCPVVLVPNPQTLPAFDPAQLLLGANGLAWGLQADALEAARATVADFRSAWLERFAHWKEELAQFIRLTQELALALAPAQAWPQPARDRLPGLCTEPGELAARADRLKWARLHSQYEAWCERTSLREIDATLYAEHITAGRMQDVGVVIDQRRSSPERLADTLDALFQGLCRPLLLVVLADQACPPGFDEIDGLLWFDCSTQAQAWRDWRCPLPGLVLVESGTTLAPQALAEWALAHLRWPQAQLVYADEDVRSGAQKQARYPYFKPDANVELLRCCNYLGSAVWVQSAWWQEAGKPLFDGSLYAQALTLLHTQGRDHVGHIDRVLAHSAARMDSAREAAEFDAAAAVLKRLGIAQRLQPLPLWGTWLPLHQAPPDAAAALTLVVPSGTQTGYLRALLQALELLPEPALHEVLVVCHVDDEAEVMAAVRGACTLALRLVLDEQAEYVHARRLNLGVAQARTPLLLVCDDDTEPLHRDWLKPLLAIAAQADVGCVAPRLMSSRDANPKVVGGPAVLGIHGSWAPYNGEEGHIDEAGVYSRLQLSQDVGAVAGHFFVFKREHWELVGGFDAQTFGLCFTVLDFCLRLGARGLRHVWTPLANAVHHGGKTLEVQMRDPKRQLVLAQTELAEREALLQRWSAQLARDPNYNRHLSLLRPYDIESDVIIDWEPARHERARILSTTLYSGSGQYRIVDPLDELQQAGLAQTCVVLPMRGSNQLRLLQPLEVARAAATTLVLQHAIDDGQIGLIEHYRRACPGLLIVQMVDDLFGEVPEQHPYRVFHSREGHQRIIRALQLSDRLVVTTEPLRQHYQRYVSDVRIVPNSLRAHWFEHAEPNGSGRGAGASGSASGGAKLRVGWVGAAQHQGDLEMIAAVVEATASEFDWVFMGMCVERIRPHIREMHNFVPIVDYPAKMAQLRLDIATAPLEDNIFNRCKSNLRLLEYGAMGWPVVCSDVYPYRSNDPPVLHCPPEPEAWVAALRRLAADRSQREAAGRALNAWVRKHYSAGQHVAAWLQALT